MTWVAWRQFRTQALVTLALLAAFAVLVLVSGLHLRDIFRPFAHQHCPAAGPCPAPPVTGLDKPLTALLPSALLIIPALLGMFWGAPLVAREIETGTHRLAWTQSVSRRRWLTVRVAIVGLAALAVAGLASWLVSWWFAPLDASNMNRLDPGVFTARGVVAVGYAAFAFALGVAAGALARRTLPAMAATLLGFIAVRIAFSDLVRSHLLPLKHVLFPLMRTQGVGLVGSATSANVVATPPEIPNAWAVSGQLVDRAHHVLSAPQLHALLVRSCPGLASGLPPNPGVGVTKGPAGLGGGVFTRCLGALSHHLQLLVAYQPSSHYWTLQALEAGIFLAAGCALIGMTIWLVGRRPNHADRAVRAPAPLRPATLTQ